jgi:hypothetical protein
VEWECDYSVASSLLRLVCVAYWQNRLTQFSKSTPRLSVAFSNGISPLCAARIHNVGMPIIVLECGSQMKTWFLCNVRQYDRVVIVAVTVLSSQSYINPIRPKRRQVLHTGSFNNPPYL